MTMHACNPSTRKAEAGRLWEGTLEEERLRVSDLEKKNRNKIGTMERLMCGCFSDPLWWLTSCLMSNLRGMWLAAGDPILRPQAELGLQEGCFFFPNHFLKVKMIDIFIPWVINLLRKLFSIGGKAPLGWRGHNSVYMVRFYRTGAEGTPQESLLHKHEGLSLDPRTH